MLPSFPACTPTFLMEDHQTQQSRPEAPREILGCVLGPCEMTGSPGMAVERAPRAWQRWGGQEGKASAREQQAGEGLDAFPSQCLILSVWVQQSLPLRSQALARDVLR